MKSLTRQSTRLIVLNLIAIAVALWFLTIAKTYIVDLEPDGFAFVSRLPAWFWVGLALAIASALMLIGEKGDRHPYLEMLAGLVLVLYIIATPQFVYENVRIRDLYGVTLNTDRIVADEHIEIGVSTTLMETYPAGTLAFAVSAQVLGISARTLARWYPLYLVPTLVLLAWCMARQLRAMTMIAAVTAISFAWTQEYNLAPQAHALILYATLWVLLIRTYATTQPKRQVGGAALVLVLVGAIVLTHIGTPVFLLLNLWAVSVFLVGARLIPRLDRRTTTGQRVMTVALFASVIWLTWLAYVAEPSFRSVVTLARDAVSEAIRGNLVPVPDFSGASVPEPHFASVNRIRVLLTAVQVALGASGIAVLWLKGRKWLAGFLGVWFLSCFATVPLSMASHAQLYIARTLLISLVPLAPLVAASVDSHHQSGASVSWKAERLGYVWQAVVVLVILSGVALLPLTRYTGDAPEVYSSSSLAAFEFAREHAIAAPPTRPPATPSRLYLHLNSNEHDYLELWGRGDEYVKWVQQTVEPGYATIYDSGESHICARAVQ